MAPPSWSNTDREPTDEEVKEVYTEFGAAYCFSEALHRGLRSLSALSRAPEGGEMAQPRIEEPLPDASFSALPPDVAEQVRAALESRDFLAHHFWNERAPLLLTAEGTRSCVAELRLYRRQYQEADAQVRAVLRMRQGVKEDQKPVSTRRPVKREETIVAVYDASTSAGGQTLIFQTEDGALLQLCEAGLGWSQYDRVMPQWPASKDFEALLPAKVRTHPPIEEPWRYEIPLGPTAALAVQWVSGRGCYSYCIRKGRTGRRLP